MGAVSCCRLTGARDQSSGALRAVAIQIVLGVLPMLAGTSEPFSSPRAIHYPSTGLPAPCSCFTLLCLQVQRPAGRQSSETSWRQTLLVDAARCVLVHYWVCAVLLRTTARCSACAAFVVASAAGLQGGCRRDSPSCGTRSCVRFRSCRASSDAGVGG